VSNSFAQSEVTWHFSFDADASQVKAEAAIGEGWHLYSIEKATDMGPIPTAFEFTRTEGVEFVGTVEEPKPKVAYDENFGETLYYHEEEAEFTQNVKVTSAKEVSGTVTYMVCNDEMCMPPVDVEFTIELVHEK